MKLDPNFNWENREGTKLSNKQVEEIILSDKPTGELAEKYDVKIAYIQRLQRGDARRKVYAKVKSEL